jgi:hypothetical protein
MVKPFQPPQLMLNRLKFRRELKVLGTILRSDSEPPDSQGGASGTDGMRRLVPGE